MKSLLYWAYMAKHIVAVIDIICYYRDGDMKKYWTHFWHRRYGNCFTFNKGMDATGSYVNVMNTSQPGFGNFVLFFLLLLFGRRCLNWKNYSRLFFKAQTTLDGISLKRGPEHTFSGNRKGFFPVFRGQKFELLNQSCIFNNVQRVQYVAILSHRVMTDHRHSIRSLARPHIGQMALIDLKLY